MSMPLKWHGLHLRHAFGRPSFFRPLALFGLTLDWYGIVWRLSFQLLLGLDARHVWRWPGHGDCTIARAHNGRLRGRTLMHQSGRQPEGTETGLRVPLRCTP